MTCVVTIADGINPPVVMQGTPALAVAYQTLAEGGAILRFLDGSAAKQQRWYKEQITVSGSDRVPPGLTDLDYTQVLTLTVDTPVGTDIRTTYSMGPSENWDLRQGTVGWSIVLEEN